MASNAAARTRGVTFGLFLVFHALYALTSSGNVFRIPDEFEVYFQTENLVDNGDLSIPQTLQIREAGQPIFFGKFGIDGKPYAPYGPLAAVLAVPHHLAGRALASMLGIERLPRVEGLAWVIFVGGVTMLSTATGAALAVAGFHRAALLLGTPPRAALSLSLLLGGATVLWPYGTSFYSEGWQAATIIWAAVFVIQGRITSAAALLALTGLIKATSLIFLPAFMVWALADSSRSRQQRIRHAVMLAVGIGAAVLIHLFWNQYRFGSPFEVGYDWAETIPLPPPRPFLITDIPRGLLVLTATPGKSLFLWAPMLVLSVIGAAAWWRRDRALTLGVITAVATGLVVFASYLWPEGGYAHGPRHLVPIVPLFALLAAGPDAWRWSRAALIACAIAGLALAVPSTVVSFLEDQGLRRSPDGVPIPGYYEVIEPAQGRPSNRYRPAYVPFVTATSNPEWTSEKTALGRGPDLFLMHLEQARRQLPDGRNIPASFKWWWMTSWAIVAALGALMIRRAVGGVTPRDAASLRPEPAPLPPAA